MVKRLVKVAMLVQDEEKTKRKQNITHRVKDRHAGKKK